MDIADIIFNRIIIFQNFSDANFHNSLALLSKISSLS